MVMFSSTQSSGAAKPPPPKRFRSEDPSHDVYDEIRNMATLAFYKLLSSIYFTWQQRLILRCVSQRIKRVTVEQESPIKLTIDLEEEALDPITTRITELARLFPNSPFWIYHGCSLCINSLNQLVPYHRIGSRITRFTMRTETYGIFSPEWVKMRRSFNRAVECGTDKERMSVLRDVRHLFPGMVDELLLAIKEGYDNDFSFTYDDTDEDLPRHQVDIKHGLEVLVRSLPKLTHLDLNIEDIMEHFEVLLSGLTDLTSLTLEDCHYVTDPKEMVDYISGRYTNLTRLQIQHSIFTGRSQDSKLLSGETDTQQCAKSQAP